MRTTSGKILFAIPTALVAVVVVLPLVGLVLDGLRHGIPAGAHALPGPTLADFGRTVVVGGTAALVALLVGIPAAVVHARVRLPGKRWLGMLGIVPIAISPTVHAYAWLIYPGGDSLIAAGVRAVLGATPGGVAAAGAPPWVCGAILGLCYWPIVAFLSAAMLRAGGGHLEEVASTQADDRRVFRRIVLARLAPGARAGAFTVYFLAAASFSVPSLLGVRTLSTEVFAIVSASGSTRPALLGALGLLVSTGLPLVLWVLWGRRRPVHVHGPEGPGRELRSGRILLLSLAGIGIVLGAVLPVASLATQLRGGGAFVRAWTLGAEPLLHSAIVAAAAATLASGMGFLHAAGMRFGRSEGSRAGILAGLAVLVCGYVAFALPPYLLGQGLVPIYNHPGPLRWIYEGWPVIALGLAAGYFLPATILLGFALARVPPTTLEAAAAAGAGPVPRLVRIVVPLLRRDLAAVWLLLFALFLGEAGSAVMREPPGFQTMQVLVFNQMHYGRGSDVAALSLLVVAFAVLPLLLASVVVRQSSGATRPSS